jgi:hypothetical protein
MPITNAQAAAYGLLVAAAEAMFTGPLTPPAAPGVTAAGWTIVGYITAQDTILRSGPLRMAPKVVFYGFVAKRTPPGGATPYGPMDEFVAVIRGTAGLTEWIEDGLFAAMPYRTPIALSGPPDPVMVEQGFFELYESMTLIDPAGAPLGPLVSGITELIGEAGSIVVVGHSLGAALATYLTLDLVRGLPSGASP